MSLTNFIYADLSTYTPTKTIAFYENVFGWTYHKFEDYYTAYLGTTEVSGLYETPEKFKQMRMPHFWMSYIRVNSVAATVQKAKKLGGIIELESKLYANEKIALIRDPLGAGFTVYEGNQLQNIRTKNTPNTLIWNELHVSNAAKILPFYQGIFNWNIEQENDCYKVLNHQNEHIASIKEIPNKYKGSYEYWACTFGVNDIQVTKKLILENGGTEIATEDHRILCTDNSNEAFFYIEALNI